VMLSTAQLARRWDVSPGTLRNWRVAGKGPKWIKIGNLVRYRLSEVQKWEARKK
jgi:predicted DNA-binding transcriptional regulator AlpA